MKVLIKTFRILKKLELNFLMDTRTLFKKIDNLSVSYSDDFGGAAKAAYRINDCLQKYSK